ncbi:hypothetical protein [Occallatibacter riparius]|uniref:Uncharacterized protein n=1 Tax=Occallatibacter riparius TaxID=1002689 RepID=A0A9J7BPG3_9BACT|nr:hypothetical protein [Occallatibacter riparius]UWZ84772.1 hypothetical protein MOP44_02280 [Occallatibacter riparius]
MSGCSNLPRLIWVQGEYSQRNADGFEAEIAQPKMTRVQIEALVSGEFSPLLLAPDLVCRLNRAWAGAGQHVHMLQVEVVYAPMNCPHCGVRALYRRERRGFLQCRVFPRLGFYPWRCASCRRSALLRLRSSNQDEIAGFTPPETRQARRAA